MSRIRSSFSGVIEEIPGIYVDNFRDVDHYSARAYFLSHYHTDHIQGIHSRDLIRSLKQTKAIIYTTQLTAAIIDDECSDTGLMKYVRGLKSGSTLITLPSIPQKNIPELCLTVTLIPAGHSAGSTMFLFRTSTVTVLFSGDFRVNCKDLPKYTSLQNNGIPIAIDALYVDTTFIDVEYGNFPKRSDSVECVVHEINLWLRDAGNGVALYTPAKYGYEFLFNEIYKQLGYKVYVNSQRWKFYSKIPHLVPGVTNDKDSKIHLCRHKFENASHEECIGIEHHKYLLVYLSAMKWKNYVDDFRPVERVTPTRIDVCFATHCSRKELMCFINYLSPKKIVGFPNTYDTSRQNFKYKNEIKKARVDKKVDENLLRLIFD